MDIQVTTRHCTVPDALRQRAEQRVARLTRYEPRITLAEVVFTEEGDHREAELIIKVPAAPPVVARGSGASLRVALDAALQRVARRLRRLHGKRVDHQARKPAPVTDSLEA